MTDEITLPVFVRVGEADEAHFGDLTITLSEGRIELPHYRREMASFLRAAADEIENPSPNEGDDDAAP
ncbi:hypothetical protein [Streptomyces sp. NPDC058280]|uniref:hypothetical protein n=1 Tax=Streptomyces sp. NPDC058280 TaxID=3346419 RepID=UPI0036DFCA82